MNAKVVLLCLAVLVIGFLMGVVSSGNAVMGGGIAKDNACEFVSTNEDGNVMYKWNIQEDYVYVFNATSGSFKRVKLEKAE